MQARRDTVRAFAVEGSPGACSLPRRASLQTMKHRQGRNGFRCIAPKHQRDLISPCTLARCWKHCPTSALSTAAPFCIQAAQALPHRAQAGQTSWSQAAQWKCRFSRHVAQRLHSARSAKHGQGRRREVSRRPECRIGMQSRQVAGQKAALGGRQKRQGRGPDE